MITTMKRKRTHESSEPIGLPRRSRKVKLEEVEQKVPEVEFEDELEPEFFEEDEGDNDWNSEEVPTGERAYSEEVSRALQIQ